MADFFESTVKHGVDAKKVSNWIQSELFRLQKASGDATDDDATELGKLTPETLAGLQSNSSIQDRLIPVPVSKKSLSGSIDRAVTPSGIVVQELGLAQISDAGALGPAGRR